MGGILTFRETINPETGLPLDLTFEPSPKMNGSL
jgi:hypothetical protein